MYFYLLAQIPGSELTKNIDLFSGSPETKWIIATLFCALLALIYFVRSLLRDKDEAHAEDLQRLSEQNQALEKERIDNQRTIIDVLTGDVGGIAPQLRQLQADMTDRFRDVENHQKRQDQDLNSINRRIDNLEDKIKNRN